MAGKLRWYHQGRASGGWHAPRLMRVWIVAPLAVAAASGVGYVIYRFVVDRLVANASDAIRTTLAILTLAGAVLAGVYAYRKQRIAESDAHRADANQFADRYTTAAEQLGHEKAAVRLAGVYALARLADDWEEQRQVCIDVLCAYIRMPYQTDPDVPGYKEGEREVRHSVIRLIRDHLRPGPEHAHSWQGRDFDFTGATFDGGDFSNAAFSGGTVSFTRAAFSGGTVNFTGTKFSGSKVSFDHATFSAGEVRFTDATFSDGTVDFRLVGFFGGTVRFAKTKFSGGTVSFERTLLAGGKVSFASAEFSGSLVRFTGAAFSSSLVRFNRASFSGGPVIFTDAAFSGGIVDFTDATFSASKVRFTDATFSGGEVRFHDATFSGGDVRFDDATFSGSSVNL